MSVDLEQADPEFIATRWIASETINIGQALDVFNPDSNGVREACINFMEHLVWHENRLVALKPKIEGLLDNISAKPGCLFELGQLLNSVETRAGHKRHLAHASGSWASTRKGYKRRKKV